MAWGSIPRVQTLPIRIREWVGSVVERMHPSKLQQSGKHRILSTCLPSLACHKVYYRLLYGVFQQR
jgi:hypothetical protein